MYNIWFEIRILSILLVVFSKDSDAMATYRHTHIYLYIYIYINSVVGEDTGFLNIKLKRTQLKDCIIKGTKTHRRI